jgi:hypothetical protein
MGNMGEDRLKKMVDKVPKAKLESLSHTEGAQEVVDRLREDPRVQAIANKVRSIQSDK